MVPIFGWAQTSPESRAGLPAQATQDFWTSVERRYYGRLDPKRFPSKSSRADYFFHTLPGDGSAIALASSALNLQQ